MKFAAINKTFELPAEISDFDELRQSLASKLDFYKSLVVTEDGIKSAKNDRANLNRLRKTIDEERKKIKARYFEPYQAIENECKQLIALIDEPVQAIDEQIKAFDEQALQEKRNVLEEHFRTENPPDFLRLDDVLNPKWRNKTEKTDSLKSQITEKIFQIKSDFAYLQSMYSESPLRSAIFRKYAETKDKSATLAYAVELERSETHGNAPVSVSVSGNVITLPDTADAVTDDYRGSQTISGAFRVSCTKSQLVALRDFMLKNNIKFEVIREEKL